MRTNRLIVGILVAVLLLGSIPSNAGAVTPSFLEKARQVFLNARSANVAQANAEMVNLDGVLVPRVLYDLYKQRGNKARAVVELSSPVFDGSTTNWDAFKAEADAMHSLVLAQIKSVAPSATKKRDLYTAVNGFTVEVSLDQLPAVMKLSSKGLIKAVHLSNAYEASSLKDASDGGSVPSYLPVSYSEMQAAGITPDMVNSAGLIGAQEAWSSGYTGAYQYVAIIDTGIDYTHENFGGYTTFPNVKIPYGWDFYYNDPDPMDHFGHGTHVAGTVAGIGARSFPDKNGNLVPLKGIAPDAKLIAAKVFSDDESVDPYAWEDDIVAAIDYVIRLKYAGVNVVAANMSLGARKGFDDPNDPEQAAIKRAYDAGITFAISAGNNAYFDYSVLYSSGGYYSTYVKDVSQLGSPGATRYAITVAAVNNQGTVLKGEKLTFGEEDYVMYLASTQAPHPVDVFGATAVTVVDTGTVLCATDGNDYTDKVVLVNRGTCTFEAKVNNARSQGAVGVIVGNYDTDRTLISMSLGTAANTIPAVFINGPDKLKLRGAIAAAAGGSLQATFTRDTAIDYAPTDPNGIASFTSWGPAPNLAFKPTVAAPGVSIFSSVPGNGYETYQGTSMAAPHVAGAIALIKQAHPDWTPEQIKQALVNTAEPIGTYSPRVQGAGRINVRKAIANNVFITYNGQPYAELGVFNGNKTITLTVENKGTTTFTASLSGYLRVTDAQYSSYGNAGRLFNGGSVSVPTSITVPAGGNATVEVTITPDPVFKNVFMDGRVLFSSGDFTRVFPFMGFYGDWSLYSDPDTFEGNSYWPFNNNIVDLPYWNLGSWNLLTGLYWDGGDGYYYIGKMLLDQFGFAYKFDRNSLAISPQSSYSVFNDHFVLLMNLLRNAERLNITVRDFTGQVIKTVATETQVRGTALGGYLIGWENLWKWDGTDDTGAPVQEGLYTVRIEAYPGKVVGSNLDVPPQIMEIPVRVDRRAPKFNVNADSAYVSRNILIPTASVITLTFTGADPSTILGYETMWNDGWLDASFDVNNTSTTIIDLNEISGYDGQKLLLEMAAIDGAGNIGRLSKSLVLDSKDTPVSVPYLNVSYSYGSLRVSTKVSNAPGATFTITVKDDSNNTVATYSGIATSPSYNVYKSFVLPMANYTVMIDATDIYGNTIHLEKRFEVGT